VHCNNQVNRIGGNWRNSSINNPYNHAGSSTANQATEDCSLPVYKEVPTLPMYHNRNEDKKKCLETKKK
jgi:hypothetical protein